MIVKIKKGQHKSNEWYKLFFGFKIERIYTFSEKSTYDLGDEDQQDWNKLFGFTSGIFIKFKVLFKTDERIKYCDFKVKVPFVYHSNADSCIINCCKTAVLIGKNESLL